MKRKPRQTPLENLTRRLQDSRNVHERRALLCGFHYPRGFPVLLDDKLLFEHVHILGATGSAKTSIGLQSLALQLIRRGDGPVIIIDGKPDVGLFHSIAEETRLAKRILKWWTNRARHSSYIFNLWDQDYLGRLSIQELLGLVTQALNLVHGSDYARSWFGIAARIILERALNLAVGRQTWDNALAGRSRNPRDQRGGAPITRFRDLLKYLSSAAEDPDDLRAAKHLLFLLESLTDYEQLNLSSRNAPHQSAVRHAIQWSQVIRENQVIYFALDGAADLALVGLVGRLILATLAFAAKAYREKTRRRPRIYLLCDEAQMLVAKNVGDMLATVRDAGISCILAHQNMSQLDQPGGADLRPIFMDCTAAKMCFSARDPWLIDYLSEMSGQVKYYRRSYQATPADVARGRIGLRYAAPDADGHLRVNLQEYFGPRLTPEHIRDISRKPNLSFLSVQRTEGVTQYSGIFPVYNEWPISSRRYERYEEAAWPAEDEATITMNNTWPYGGEGTIVPTTHPEIALPEELKADSRLDRISRRLKGES